MTPAHETPLATDAASPTSPEDSLEIVRLGRVFLEFMAEEDMPILKARPGYKIGIVEEDGSLSPFNPKEFLNPGTGKG